MKLHHFLLNHKKHFFFFHRFHPLYKGQGPFKVEITEGSSCMSTKSMGVQFLQICGKLILDFKRLRL